MTGWQVPTVTPSDGVVVLRPFTLDDVAAVTAACQDPDIPRWTSAVPSPYTEHHAREWITTHPEAWARGTAANWAVVDATDGALLGACGLHDLDHQARQGEIGYWVAPWARGQRVATRAARLTTEWGFTEGGLIQIDLLTMHGNARSEKVAAGAGYVYVGEVVEVPTLLDPGRTFDAKHWVRTVDGRPARDPHSGRALPR
jgi:RimJ/RimL family protein N-acetyltransferase